VTERADASRDELIVLMREAGHPEVSMPKKIITVPSLPLLGSGKTDYPALERMIG
jgi:acyl-[acyl-carrier-protein]-phospholipid O-acyltransferase/long-chain-fatty-acid--[acyl-carrier-protein] ligase